MDWDGFDQIQTTDDFWGWMNNSFLPGIYNNTDPHVFIPLDQILLRQIRLKPRPCHSDVFDVTEEVATCYPRLEDGFTHIWEPPYPSWKNTTLNDNGKSYVFGESGIIYYSQSYSVSLSIKNYTEVRETINKLIEDEWIDWGTQAIIIEFLVYSPNVNLVGAGVILGEFSNLGTFEGSHDVVIISEVYVRKNYSWEAVVLILFLTGFFFSRKLWMYLCQQELRQYLIKKMLKKLVVMELLFTFIFLHSGT